MPKGETRFNADAWIQVWVTEKELKEDPEIKKICRSNRSRTLKVILCVLRARQVAREKASLLKAENVEIAGLDFDPDHEFNDIDWEGLLS